MYFMLYHYNQLRYPYLAESNVGIILLGDLMPGAIEGFVAGGDAGLTM
jgi:hypothetical protein